MKKILYITTVIPGVTRDPVISITRSRIKSGMTILLLILLMIPTLTYAYTFSQTLTLGSTGSDVYELQKFLNSNPQTQVAVEGAGSPSNETSYFGPKTAQAVIKLQNLYATEILTPNNLTQGTGFVGQSTIAFLNSMQNNGQLPTTGTAATNSTSTTTETPINKANILAQTPQFFVSKTAAKAKDVFYVGSQHTLKDAATFYLGEKELRKKCRNEYTCELRMDRKIEPGTYALRTDDASWGTYTFTVLSSKEKAPRVKIKSLNLIGENLIKGSYFSDTIKIYTMYGVYTSETKNNSFILTFPPAYIQNATSTKGLFYIENENGLTSNIEIIRYEK